MKFVVLASALNGEDPTLTLIDRLVDRLADQVHCVEIPQSDLLQESSWYQNARPTRRKVLTSALASPPRKSSQARGPHVKAVEVNDARSARLADKLAHTPLVVLVEDRESEGVLLEILVEELGWPALRELWWRGQEATPRAVEIETAGGSGSIPQRVKRIARDAASEGRTYRLFVLCDSDARWPGDDVSQKPITAVHDACVARDVPYHVWKKRCAENYIPDEVFEAVRDDPANRNHVHRFDALLRRSPQQRDHFPVKDGLRSDEREKAIESGLYDARERENLEDLEERLFPKRPRTLTLLYKERRFSFTAEGLQRRDGKGEIDQLLQAIAQEL